MKTKNLCIVAAVCGWQMAVFSDAPADGREPDHAEANKKSAEISGEVEHFYKVVNELIDILKSDADPTVKEEAVDALRRFRAEKAVWVLLDNLTTIRKAERNRPDWGPLVGYACALALRDIRPAAVPGLVSQIIETRDQERVRIGTLTLCEIVGKEEARKQLQKYVDRGGADATQSMRKSFGRALEVLRDAEEPTED